MVVSNPPPFFGRIAEPSFVSAETKAKPVITTSSFSITIKAEIEGAAGTRPAIVVQVILNARAFTTVTLNRGRNLGIRAIDYRLGSECSVRDNRPYGVLRL